MAPLCCGFTGQPNHNNLLSFFICLFISFFFSCFLFFSFFLSLLLPFFVGIPKKRHTHRWKTAGIEVCLGDGGEAVGDICELQAGAGAQVSCPAARVNRHGKGSDGFSGCKCGGDVLREKVCGRSSKMVGVSFWASLCQPRGFLPLVESCVSVALRAG